MKQALFVLVLFSLMGCSSAKLKRCDAKFEDNSVLSCKDNVQGSYWKCEAPKDLYRCEEVK